MAMTEDRIIELIARAIGAAMAGFSDGRGEGSRGRVLREKSYSEVAKLSNGDQWEDWAFDFKIATGTISPEMKRCLEVIEAMPEDMNIEAVTALDPERAAKIGLQQRAAELFQILVLKSEGEAKLLTKAVSGEDGLKAWQMLYRHYHRKTFAKSIRDHRDVLYPKMLKSMKEVVTGVMEWEDRMAKLEKTYQVVPEMLKVAALVEMMPAEVKDMVYMTAGDMSESYIKLKQKIFAWTSNKTAQSGPVPMDIGGVGKSGSGCGSFMCQTCNEWDEDESGEYGCDVGAISGNCYKCGGWGHMASECPTKSKGDGGKSKGK